MFARKVYDSRYVFQKGVVKVTRTEKPGVWSESSE